MGEVVLVADKGEKEVLGRDVGELIALVLVLGA